MAKIQHAGANKMRVPALWHNQIWLLPLGALLFLWLLPLNAGLCQELQDKPVVWYAEDKTPIPMPQFDEPGLLPYAVGSFVARPFSRFWHPGRFIRKLGSGDAAAVAADINSLDEVVNSTWFTNRIGLYPQSDQELINGSATENNLAAGPDRSEPWVIIGAKTAGVTPGFRIKDARGDVWLLKFDPPSHPGMTIRAGVVTNLIFHAIGFNVPVDRLAIFERSNLVVGPGATMRLPRGGEIPMTEANLDSVLVATKSIFEGKYHALASKYLNGKPIGPFNDQDCRKDDPNDVIKHQNRRELRGMRVFAAWVNHFDTKAHNSLDMYVGQPGLGYVKHYLIDFASTLGAFGATPVKRFGYEYGFDVMPILGRTFAFGLHEDVWVRLNLQESLPEIGLIDVETFSPEEWKPDLPNSMMANMTERDGYWAAKIISAFTDEQLRLLVEQGRYQEPAAVDYLTNALVGRRDKIVSYWFDRVPPLDFFTNCPGGVKFFDLATKRGFCLSKDSQYRYRFAVTDSRGDQSDNSSWIKSITTQIDLSAADQFIAQTELNDLQGPFFLAIEVQVNRGDSWSTSTTVYRALKSGNIVALKR